MGRNSQQALQSAQKWTEDTGVRALERSCWTMPDTQGEVWREAVQICMVLEGLGGMGGYGNFDLGGNWASGNTPGPRLSMVASERAGIQGVFVIWPFPDP